MRILSIASVFPSPAFPNHGLFVYERLRHMARRAEVRVVVPVPVLPRALAGRRGAPERPPAPAGLDVRHVPFVYVPRFLKATDGFALAASIARAVLRARRERDFDLIDAHFGYPEGFAATLLGRIFARPVAITLRGTEPGHARERGRGWALAHALRRAAGIVAVSGRLRDLAIALGARPARISVVPNGVNPALFHAIDPAHARRELGIGADLLPAGARLIVSVGHLSPRKGFEGLVAAVARLLARGVDLRLAIVGGPGLEGDSRDSIAAAVRAAGLDGRVLLPGAAPPARVALWHAASDLSVLASLHEGCPNVVLEALACGAPVVATDVGNVRDLVAAEDGIVVPPASVLDLADGIGGALERPWDRRAIAARAARRTWENVAAETLDALEAARARWLAEREPLSALPAPRGATP
jgi:glycosyltransferase involved in cell wall biosynthesis